MPRGGSGPTPFHWTWKQVVFLCLAVAFLSWQVSGLNRDRIRHEIITSIIVEHNSGRDSCYVLKTSTWEVIDGSLILTSEERGTTRFFPLFDVKSVEVTERKVRINNAHQHSRTN